MWGTGSDPICVYSGYASLRQSRHANDTNVYAWEHRYITTFSWKVVAMTEAAAREYIPTPSGSAFYISNVQANRADDSEQWQVNWDETTFPGPWLSGYGNVEIVTVTFDPYGGTVPDPTTKDVGYTLLYGLLPVTTKNNYIFSGWWTGVGGTGSEVLATTVVSSNTAHTLYAKWVSV